MFACLDGLLLLILLTKIPFATGIYFWSSLVWFWSYIYGQRFRVCGTGSSASGIDSRPPRKSCGALL
jgi:hypothetical protein